MKESHGSDDAGRGPISRLITDPVKRLVEQAPISGEDRNRFQHFTVFLLLGIPTMLVFGVYAIVRGRYPLSLAVFGSALGLSLGWLLLGRLKNGAIVYRFNALLFAVMLGFCAVVGGEAGSMILWIQTFPLIAFFLLGKREGFFWCAGVGLMTLLLMTVELPWFSAFEYHPAFLVRFFLTYIMISSIAYWFENLRQRYRRGMEAERQKLEAEKTLLEREIRERQKAEAEKEELIGKLRTALDEVKTLSGMIPICSNCHKIRDDKGFWDRLENYISKRSGAEFSHGICPDCMKDLYPDIDMPEGEGSKNG